MLATVVGSEEDLGPEVNSKVPSLTLAPGGGSPLTLPAHRCSPVAERVCGRFLAPARSNQPYPVPYWDRAGHGSAQPAVSFTGAQEKGGPVGIRGDARDGSDRRVPQWLGKPDRFVTENRRLGPVLRGLSQGECGVEVRHLSNAAGWRVAWSAGYRSFLFDTGLNQRILADPLITLIQPSQRRLDCTNLSHFRLGCSGRPLPFSASWTKSSDRTPHTPLPI